MSEQRGAPSKPDPRQRFHQQGLRNGDRDTTQRIPKFVDPDKTTPLHRPTNGPTRSFSEAPTVVIEKPTWASEITAAIPGLHMPPPNDNPTISFPRSQLTQAATEHTSSTTSDSTYDHPNNNPTPEELITSALTGSAAALASPQEMRRLGHLPTHAQEKLPSLPEYMYQIGVDLVRLEGNEAQRRQVIALLAYNTFLIRDVSGALYSSKTPEEFFIKLKRPKQRNHR